jgi:hypothetical protein
MKKRRLKLGIVSLRRRRAQQLRKLTDQYGPGPVHEVRPRPSYIRPGPQPGPPPHKLTHVKTLKKGRSAKSHRVALRIGYAYGGRALVYEVVYYARTGHRWMVRQMKTLGSAEEYFSLFLKDKPRKYLGQGLIELPWINPDVR